MGLLYCRVNWSRVGLKAVVLEQSNKLRAEGVSIALYTNGMRVLQILGLADRFRSTSINIPRYESVVDSLSARVSNLYMISIMRRFSWDKPHVQGHPCHSKDAVTWSNKLLTKF